MHLHCRRCYSFIRWPLKLPQGSMTTNHASYTRVSRSIDVIEIIGFHIAIFLSLSLSVSLWSSFSIYQSNVSLAMSPHWSVRFWYDASIFSVSLFLYMYIFFRGSWSITLNCNEWKIKDEWIFFFCSNGVYFEMNGNIDGILDGRIDFWWFLLEYVTCVSFRNAFSYEKKE